MAVKGIEYLHVREAAKHNIPQTLVSRKDKTLVAVLLSGVNLSKTLNQDDFLWVTAKAKSSAGKIRRVYESQRDQEQSPRFVVADKVVEDRTKLEELDFYHDKMIVLMIDNESTADSPSSGAAAPSATPAIIASIAVDSPPSSAHCTPTATSASPARIGPNTSMDMPTRTQISAATPVQPLTQLISPHSPDRRLPTPQPSTEMPGTPTNAQKFPTDLYGNSPGGPLFGPQDRRHPEYPPVKPQKTSAMPHHVAQQPASTAHHHPAHPAPAPAPSQTAQVTKPGLENQSLETLMSENGLERLEAGVKQAFKLLDKIEQPLEACQQQDLDAKEWLKSIHELKGQNLKHRTILGVVGNTGADKSSVINAMLDQERLVPTNCMRACTAVVTELSWNESNDHFNRYRAEIEFIQYEDWVKELQVLYSDLLDGSGNVAQESSNSDSEAGVAWAKIKAVYPQKTKAMIAAASPEELAREVQGLLGTTKRINQSAPGEFYKGLQFFVDSQEKQRDSMEKKRMEYWPLIKVVKIYTKADALSTGAVVVDLPGVQDSNAARAAVAEGYMKQCSGLWIVAPITRAIDDKAAKKLLGETFKRQLKLDGTYNNVTFICSKTDDISLQEAVSGLNLDDTVSDMWSELDEVRGKIRELQNNVQDCRDSKQVYENTVDNCDEKLEIWDALLKDCADGKIVYAPTGDSSKKRKRSASTPKNSKKKRRSEDSDDKSLDDDEESLANSDATGGKSENEVSEDREPLNEQQIQDKIQELKTMKKEAKAERGAIDEKRKGICKEIKTLKDREASIDDHISRICINGRNDYSRCSIKQDFAAGIRELDQEAAEEENAEEFDPEVNLRDYDEVARSLPVFCVSSWAYQKLCGRLKRDKAVPGFNDVSETEVPKLQAHCKQLTEAGRIACARRFLSSLSRFLTSMNLWATNDGPGSIIAADQRRQEQTFLDQKLEDLREGVEKIVRNTLSDIAATLAEHVYSNYEKVVKKACEAACPTASSWGAPLSMGGLRWATFKATVRRSGVYTGASGPRDFNAELENTLKELQTFRNAVVQRARLVGVSMARLNQLDTQLRNHEWCLNDLVSAIVDMVNTRQKEINRGFVPVIASAMEHAYQWAKDQSGKGSYARMKSYVNDHVAQNRERMFRDACQAVKDRLDKMCVELRQQLTQRATQVYQAASRDYNSAVGNLGAAEVELSPTEKKLRSDVEAILRSAENTFARVLDGGEDLHDEAAAPAQDEVDQGEEAAAQDEHDNNDDHVDVHHPPVKQEQTLATHETDTIIAAAAEDLISRPLADELFAEQHGNKENVAAADPDANTGKPKPLPMSKSPSADAARNDGFVLGETSNQAVNRPPHAFEDASAACIN